MKIVGNVAWFLVAVLLLTGILLPAHPVRAAAGVHSSGRNLLDANGNNFIIRGISHPHFWYQNQTRSFVNIKSAGGQRGKLQDRFAKADWSNSTETSDYSFDPTKFSFVDWDHVTLYRNGVLLWGTEP